MGFGVLAQKLQQEGLLSIGLVKGIYGVHFSGLLRVT